MIEIMTGQSCDPQGEPIPSVHFVSVCWRDGAGRHASQDVLFALPLSQNDRVAIAQALTAAERDVGGGGPLLAAALIELIASGTYFSLNIQDLATAWDAVEDVRGLLASAK